MLREVKGLEFEKKLKFQSFFSLRGWFCPSPNIIVSYMILNGGEADGKILLP